jgi:hypothetical protein
MAVPSLLFEPAFGWARLANEQPISQKSSISSGRFSGQAMSVPLEFMHRASIPSAFASRRQARLEMKKAARDFVKVNFRDLLNPLPGKLKEKVRAVLVGWRLDFLTGPERKRDLNITRAALAKVTPGLVDAIMLRIDMGGSVPAEVDAVIGHREDTIKEIAQALKVDESGVRKIIESEDKKLLDEVRIRRFNLRSPAYRIHWTAEWEINHHRALAMLARGPRTEHKPGAQGTIDLDSKLQAAADLQPILRETPRSLWGLRLMSNHQRRFGDKEVEWVYVPARGVKLWLPLVVHEKEAHEKGPVLVRAQIRGTQVLTFTCHYLALGDMAKEFANDGPFTICGRNTPSGKISLGLAKDGRNVLFKLTGHADEPFAATIGFEGFLTNLVVGDEAISVRTAVLRDRTGTITKVIDVGKFFQDYNGTYSKYGPFWIMGIQPTMRDPDNVEVALGLQKVREKLVPRRYYLRLRQGEKVEALVGLSNVPIYLGYEGRKGRLLRLLEIRRDGRDPQSVMAMADSGFMINRAMFSSAIIKAKRLLGVVVATRLPVIPHRETTALVVHAADDIVYLPAQFTRSLPNNLQAEIIYDRENFRPVAARVGTFASDSPFDLAPFVPLREFILQPDPVVERRYIAVSRKNLPRPREEIRKSSSLIKKIPPKRLQARWSDGASFELFTDPPPGVKDPEDTRCWEAAGYPDLVDSVKERWGSWRNFVRAAKAAQLQRKAENKIIKPAAIPATNEPTVLAARYIKDAWREVKSGWSRVLDTIPDLIDESGEGFVSKFRPLTPEEERTLGIGVQEGESASRAALIASLEQSVEKLVNWFLKTRPYLRDREMDLRHEGLYGRLKESVGGAARAVELFDPMNGKRLASYASPFIVGQLCDSAEAIARRMKHEISLDEQLGNGVGFTAPSHDQKSRDLLAQAYRLVRELPVAGRDKELFWRVVAGHNMRDVGAHFGLRESEVSQRCHNIRKLFRKGLNAESRHERSAPFRHAA